jgi:TRAP-type C4-dicarboxylate transport system permease small subunit
MVIAKIANFLEKIIYPLIKVVHKIGLIILLLMMFLTIVDVAGRKFFSAPITGSYELTEFMLALLIFSSVAYTQIQKGHIAMEALVSRFSPRTQGIVDSIVYFVSMILALLLTWQLFAHAKRLRLGDNVTGVLHLPIHPFVIATAIGTLFYFFVLLVDFFKSLQRVIQNES